MTIFHRKSSGQCQTPWHPRKFRMTTKSSRTTPRSSPASWRTSLSSSTIPQSRASAISWWGSPTRWCSLWYKARNTLRSTRRRGWTWSLRTRRRCRATCRSRTLRRAGVPCSSLSRCPQVSTSPTAAWTPRGSATPPSTEVPRRTTIRSRWGKISSRAWKSRRGSSGASPTFTDRHLPPPPPPAYLKPSGKSLSDELCDLFQLFLVLFSL